MQYEMIFSALFVTSQHCWMLSNWNFLIMCLCKYADCDQKLCQHLLKLHFILRASEERAKEDNNLLFWVPSWSCYFFCNCIAFIKLTFGLKILEIAYFGVQVYKNFSVMFYANRNFIFWKVPLVHTIQQSYYCMNWHDMCFSSLN